MYPSMTIEGAPHYCRKIGIRFLVVFRPYQYRTGNLLRVKDIFGKDHGDKDSGSNNSSSNINNNNNNNNNSSDSGWREMAPEDIIPMLKSLVIGYQRSQSTASKQGSSSIPHVSSSSHHANQTSQSHHSASHHSLGTAGEKAAIASKNKAMKDVDVDILDPQGALKSHHKQKIFHEAGRMIGPLVVTYNVSTFRIVAIDLNIIAIRELTSAYYRDKVQAVEKTVTVLLSTAARQNANRKLLEELQMYINTKILVNNKINFLYIYSVCDRKFDIMFCN